MSLTPEQAEVERLSKRRAVLERLVERVRKTRRFRLSRHCVPQWTPEELAVVLPFAERVKAGEISEYRGTVECHQVLPTRTWEAIRKKIKNWKLYGEWR